MELMTINYLYRQRWYGTVNNLITSTATADPVLALFKATSLLNLEHISEALQVLSSFTTHSDACVAAFQGSIFVHNSCQVVDREAVNKLEEMLREHLCDTRTANSFYLESVLQYLLGQHNEAVLAAESCIKIDPSCLKALNLLGWLQLDLKKNRIASRYFSQALKDKDNSDAMMGELHCINSLEALSKINKLVVRHPKEMVPILYKMELLLNTRQWDVLADTILRAAGIDSTNMFVLQMQALKLVITDGKYNECALILEKLHYELERQESKAWWLFLENLSFFSRVCGGNLQIYSCLERYAKSALRIRSGKDSPKVLLEVGHFYYLWGKKLYYSNTPEDAREILKVAESTLRRAANSDESTRSLVFLIMIELVNTNNLKKQVFDQLELLRGLGAEKDNPEFFLAEVLSRSISDHDSIVQLLDKAVSAQQNKSASYKYGIAYLIALDPQLLVDIAFAYPKTKFGEKHRIRVLALVVETVPGFVDATIELGKTHLANGQYNEALSVLQRASNVDPNNPQNYLLQAEIYLTKGELEKGRNLLEMGLSNNLQIMELPAYHVLQANLAIAGKNEELAISELKQAISTSKGKNSLSSEELSKVYLDLSDVYMKTNKIKEAAESIKDARELLSGAADSSAIFLTEARLSLVNGDVKAALALLSSVPKENIFYTQAQKEKAEIFLRELQDGLGYAQCYQTLVELDPSTDNIIMLADAYMNIQEPELAIKTYERAMSKNIDDNRLSCRLARIFVKCHLYSKAIKAYKSSGEEGCLELAELLLKLGQPEKAEQALANVPLSKKAIILAKIYEKLNDFTRAISMLREVTSLQNSTDPEWMSKLYRQMAVYCTSQRDYKQAIELYKRALQYTPNELNLQIALVKLYLQVDDWSNCEETCRAILTKEPDNEPALLTTADLALRRVDLTSAKMHFSSILDRRPDYWVALARLIEICRRCDKLDSALPYLQLAKENSGGHTSPGLSYCQGLYEWYKGDTQAAVASFNTVRTDAEWGPQAIYNMIEMALAQCGQGNTGGAATAHRLLAELRPRGEDEENTIGLVEGFIRLATGDKTETEKAIIDFTSLANSDSLRVGASLGLAMGYVEQNQMTRAKAVLKRVAKLPWSLEEADYLERCWLMLAEIYINNGVQQAAQAQDLLQRVISHNRSCIKAFTLLATLASKENNYQKAGEHYRQAWNLSGENDPSLGYKLAYTQLKSKLYADAIATCQRVLQIHPDYPKIKKDILDKALPRLRT